MTAQEASSYLFIVLCGAVLFFGLVGLLWGLLVAAADAREVPDGNEEYLG